jgi:hypothetical protein
MHASMGRNVSIEVYVPPEVAEAVRINVERAGTSVSGYVRNQLTECS